MKAIVFLGPTLPAAEARELLDSLPEPHCLELRPPAARGDVLRAAVERPAMIGVVDGYFERVPSVTHKEILWAMQQGIHVLGAASMGALRAAELASFGMEGVGEVFQAFSMGELERDDGVAVAHALPEDGYRALSVAMVDIRATVDAAVTAGIVARETGAAMIEIGASSFYPDRCYPRILAEARARGLFEDDLVAFERALPALRVDRKKADARLLLETIAARLESPRATKTVRYAFPHTDAFAFVCESANVDIRPIAG